MGALRILKYFSNYEGSWKEIYDVREISSMDFQLFIGDSPIEIGELLYRLLEENKDMRKRLDKLKGIV
jgi:hypothetical protein